MATGGEEAAAETTKITRAEHTPARTGGGADNPPSYDSIYGRLKTVKNEATGPKDLVTRSCEVICASVVGTILLAPILAVPIAMIAVGAIHLNNCPAERYIPIYLVVGGCFGAFQTILTFALRVKNHRQEKDEDCERQARGEGQGDEGAGRGQKSKYKDTNARPNPGSGLISCFLFAWFIAGSVWVYRIYGTVTTTDESSAHYCHASAYWFAFVLITVGYVCMALSCCCFAFCGILACIFSKNE